jgi:hypothetical protein
MAAGVANWPKALRRPFSSAPNASIRRRSVS